MKKTRHSVDLRSYYKILTWLTTSYHIPENPLLHTAGRPPFEVDDARQTASLIRAARVDNLPAELTSRLSPSSMSFIQQVIYPLNLSAILTPCLLRVCKSVRSGSVASEPRCAAPCNFD